MFSFGKPIIDKPLIFLDSKNAPIGSSEFINSGSLNFQFQQYGTVTHAGDVPSTWYDSNTSIWFNESKSNYLYVDGIDLNFYDLDFTIFLAETRKDSWSGWSSWNWLLTYYVDSNNYFCVAERRNSNTDLQINIQLKVHSKVYLNKTYQSLRCEGCFDTGDWVWIQLRRHKTTLYIHYGLINDISSRQTWTLTIPEFIPPLDYKHSRLSIGSGLTPQGSPTNSLYGAMNTIYISRTFEPAGRLF